MRIHASTMVCITLGLFANLSGRGHAAIFVSDVRATSGESGIVFHYRLNEAAASGEITVRQATPDGEVVNTVDLSGEGLLRGNHAVALTESLPSGAYTFSVQVRAAAHHQYDLITPVTSIGPSASVCYGFRVNRVPGTHGYGHIFMADFQGQAHSMHPVREFAADGSFVQDIGPDRASALTTMGCAVGDDGALYVSDQDTDTIRRYTASGDRHQPAWTLDRVYTGPVRDASTSPPLGSLPTRGFQVIGEGHLATVYLTNYTTYPNQVQTGLIGQVENLGSLLFLSTGLSGRLDQLLASSDGKSVYVASGMEPGWGRHLNRWVHELNPSTNETEWRLDPEFAENNATKASLTGRARGLAFSKSGHVLWVSQNGGANSPPDRNHVAKVTLSPLAESITRALEALGYLSGAARANQDRVRELDANGDGKLTVYDAVAIMRTPGQIGAVTERVPMPPGASLPVTLDTDPAGNIVVAAASDPTMDGRSADVFYILAPPDDGSTDTATSLPFTLP